jgi:2-polyprenyl-6-methoxyphenol hydroxylase-like FAD-dependent oxidoreductase
MESPMAAHTDVLICGAGATGLVLAIELARRGVPFRLVEKLDRPFHGSRGKGIQPRSQEIFEDLGVLDRLTAAGGIYPPSRSWREDGSHTDAEMVERQPPTPAEPYRLPLMVPQAITEAILRERLLELGHRPAFGHELVAFEQDGDRVTARIATQEGEETVHARYLVGADGGRSFVRNALGIDFPGQTLGMRALVADIELAGLGRDAWHQFNERSSELRMSLCPLMGTGLFQLLAAVPPEGDIDVSAAGLDAMVRERSGRDDLRVHAVSWASPYRMNARLADRYRDGRVFLAGDAAHVHPPTGGQGLNTSVQDAYNLGWKLAAVLSGAPIALLDSYEEERHPIAAGMLGLSTRLLENARRGDNRRGREVQQLDLGYRGSSLAPPLPARTDGPAPGDRAPDARLLGAAGQPRRVFDLLAGTHWTLLGCNVARADLPARADLHVHAIGPAAELRDPHGDFAAAYALADGEWVLVRPDGYIGMVGDSAGVAALRAYLAIVMPGMLTSATVRAGRDLL